MIAISKYDNYLEISSTRAPWELQVDLHPYLKKFFGNVRITYDPEDRITVIKIFNSISDDELGKIIRIIAGEEAKLTNNLNRNFYDAQKRFFAKRAYRNSDNTYAEDV